MRPRRQPLRRFILLVGLIIQWRGPATSVEASVDTARLSTTPALTPAFAPTVSDYVVRCTGTTAVQVSVSTPTAPTPRRRCPSTGRRRGRALSPLR